MKGRKKPWGSSHSERQKNLKYGGEEARKDDGQSSRHNAHVWLLAWGPFCCQDIADPPHLEAYSMYSLHGSRQSRSGKEGKKEGKKRGIYQVWKRTHLISYNPSNNTIIIYKFHGEGNWNTERLNRDQVGWNPCLKEWKVHTLFTKAQTHQRRDIYKFTHLAPKFLSWNEYS